MGHIAFWSVLVVIVYGQNRKYRTIGKTETLLICNLCVSYILNANVATPLAFYFEN